MKEEWDERGLNIIETQRAAVNWEVWKSNIDSQSVQWQHQDDNKKMQCKLFIIQLLDAATRQPDN